MSRRPKCVKCGKALKEWQLPRKGEPAYCDACLRGASQ